MFRLILWYSWDSSVSALTLPEEREEAALKDRVRSAVILVAVTAACMPWAITRILYFAVAGGLCAYEYSKNVEKLNARCTLWVMIVYLAVQAALAYLHMGLFLYVVCFVFCLYLALFSGVLHREVSGIGALYTLAGMSYPCVLFGIILVISVSDIWWQTLLTACLATWVCDSAALFGGMRFGRHKLAPAVSPKKTIEGAVCGQLSSILSGLVAWWILSQSGNPVPLRVCLVTAFLGAFMGQIGDLAESLLKRMIGVKDFSNLIPGHGGVFDRADSLLFSIPTVYLCFLVVGI